MLHILAVSTCLPLSSKPKNITLREQTHTCFALSQNIFQKNTKKNCLCLKKLLTLHTEIAEANGRYIKAVDKVPSLM